MPTLPTCPLAHQLAFYIEEMKIYIDFPFQQDCEYDSLALSSKMGSGEIRKHGLFCGSRLPPVITSEGNSLRLEFNSDNSVQKSGFAAIFFTGIILSTT
jgi:hypothetical protein